MDDLKSYVMEFEEYGKMKPKIYLSNYIVEENNWQLIIVITFNEYIFSANNSLNRA